jgi:hypothetical protein
VLINIHMQGDFLRNVPCEEYLQSKSNIDLSSYKTPLPSLFIDFYSYVLNLNYNDEVNYFKWRNLIYRTIGREAIVNPYEWMIAKQKESESDSIIEGGAPGPESDQEELQDEIRP